jgi:hypothetical protein
MAFPETSHTKNVTNELIFPLVTHTIHFNIHFGCYGVLKPCFGSGQAMADWTAGVQSGFEATKRMRLAMIRIQLLKQIESAF